MSAPIDPNQLDTCGCCEADAPRPEIFNRPGLSALAYRIGTHPSFLRRMLARLPTQTVSDSQSSNARPLAALTARNGDDPSIALLDAWATVADALTFYQERIANEGYLRTATERRSVLELARSIGYELKPGVAASAFLAFTVESAAGAPGVSVVPQSTKVQSIPGQGQLPQTFETSKQITARAEWNALRPRLTQPQTLSVDATSLYFAGATTNLKPGDFLLIVVKSGATIQTAAKRIQRVVVEQKHKHTRVDFSAQPAPLPAYQPAANPMGVITLARDPFIGAQVTSKIVQRSWSESRLSAFMAIQGWSRSGAIKFIATPPAATLPPADEGVFRFRERLGFFGHNAPAFVTLATPPHSHNWDNSPPSVWQDSEAADWTGAHVYLERSVSEIVSDSWALFQLSTNQPTPYRVGAAVEASLAEYALSGKATGLILTAADGVSQPTKNAAFKFRATTAHVQSERLELAELPIVEPIAKGETVIHLDRMSLGLSVGQPVIITGERSDLDGVTVNEVATLKAITHDGGFTSLELQDALQFSYKRNTVVINANVAHATHGETVKEALGSGAGGQANQRFALKKPPLTYVSAPTASGVESSLEVRVNGILWEEAERLYGLDARSENYIVRNDDDGKTRVIFGDGQRGARLPSGVENVTAVYRSGIGLAGMVAADKLTLLQARPLGIRGVTNPLPANGAADSENRDSSRINAPLTVLTMDRIVSRQDFEDFARAFAGIGKAQAVALWRGEAQWVHLTIASKAPVATGDEDVSPIATHEVAEDSDLFKNLLAAIAQSGDPGQRFRVDGYTPVFFNLKAKVLINPRYIAADTLAAVEAALQSAFAFEQRAFGQAVTAAEVTTVIQGAPGVTAVDLDQLYRVDKPEPDFSQALFAERVRWEVNQAEPLLAELLLLNPAGVTLEEVKA
jgi:predicted phage baseplate assembly protein